MIYLHSSFLRVAYFSYRGENLILIICIAGTDNPDLYWYRINRMIFATIFATQNTRVFSNAWVMWPSISSVFSKIARQKTTQPWWPLVPSYYYAATSNRDMAGGEHHHRWPYYAIVTDDMPPPSWLAHKTTSKMVHPLMTSTYSSPSTCIVSSIYDCYGAAIVSADR